MKENREIKFRLIERVNNMTSPPFKSYVIQKRKIFLFWSWWSENYLFSDEYTCYKFYKKRQAVNMMDILTGKKKMFEEKKLL